MATATTTPKTTVVEIAARILQERQATQESKLTLHLFTGVEPGFTLLQIESDHVVGSALFRLLWEVAKFHEKNPAHENNAVLLPDSVVEYLQTKCLPHFHFSRYSGMLPNQTRRVMRAGETELLEFYTDFAANLQEALTGYREIQNA